jgi:hypothetical protein
MKMTSLFAFALVSTTALVGCGDDPINYSEPVGISLQFKSGDVVAGRIATDKNINTESGNPYAAFVSAAQTKIGKAPSRIDVAKVTLTVEASSKQVSKLGEIFAGDCKLKFVMNSGNVPFDVASRTMAAADLAGPVELTATFDSADLDAGQYAQLVGGSFKVALDCATATTFASAGATADLKATFTFGAYE